VRVYFHNSLTKPGRSLRSLTIQSCLMTHKKGFPSIEQIVRSCPKLKILVLIGVPSLAPALDQASFMSSIREHPSLPFSIIKTNLVIPGFELLSFLSCHCCVLLSSFFFMVFLPSLHVVATVIAHNTSTCTDGKRLCLGKSPFPWSIWLRPINRDW